MNSELDRSAFERHAAAVGAGMVFDDEPLDAVLYGAPSPGPSSASLFAEAEQALSAVNAALGQDDAAGALGLMAQLLDTETPVSDEVLVAMVAFVRQFVPEVPCPLVEEHGVAYDRILKPCFETGRRHGNASLVRLAGTPLYRWYEAVGRYEAAAGVIRLLLADAVQEGDRHAEAQLTNNLGYEYLLLQQWEEAAPYFLRSTAFFERLGHSIEIANGRANTLICEAGPEGPEYLAQKRTELFDLADALHRPHDWRARKPLGLIARMREWQGNCRKAILYARAAVIAGREVPSRHHLEDQAYLAELEARCADGRGRRPVRGSRTENGPGGRQ